MKCAFCDKELEKGTGKIVYEKSHGVLPFCSLKCEKNMMKLGRKPQGIEWTGRYAKEKAVRLAAEKKEKA